ncbi:aminodeoxychorismate synthase, subunit I [Bacillus sp. OV322]|uniref:anthranilate synthase component I family protein n=1 Tax=Bacillus sp. OV322 TaxID=1882764 RepID=UPI0008E7839A|nr:anthranilate synthase component I family protein [Bacillus sp. OV322]SFD01692.1 aminodeoxychorismate synthase, subunit I [Bacillus sp. OV322]
MGKRKVYATYIPFSYNQFFEAYTSLSSGRDRHVLLESGRGGSFSMAGLDHVAELIGKDHMTEIFYRDGSSERAAGKPLDALKNWMAGREAEQNKEFPDFQGGAMGFISYDYARYIEDLPNLAKDDLNTPDMYYLVFDEVAVFDHKKNRLWFMYTCEEESLDADKRLEEMKRQWTSAVKPVANERFAGAAEADLLKVSLQEGQFREAVEKVRQYIAKGDIFQVNLSVRQSRALPVPAIEVYGHLRRINPSPYMAYIHTPQFQIICGSPELLVKRKGKEISTRPIAGTRSRGADQAEDEKLAKELIENEKERAEHVMLVDLERNDMGRVCKYGSIHVDEFMVIEKYSHVMHIVSNVRGEISEGKSSFDVIEAVFPGGTITGAPKVRTMEIIEELEPVRRGVYTGSIGWIGYSEDMELNIVIRTVFVQDGMAHIQAGAGIVIDSNPKHEYNESLKKAAALWKAIESAELYLTKAD